MPEVWYMDDSSGTTIRNDCHLDPPRYITLEELKASTDVEVYEINPDSIENNAVYQRMKKERGYDYEDLLELSEKTMTKEEIEEKFKMFSMEHLHEDEEVRFFLEGGGYFDVRDAKDNWIRIHTSKGDLIIVPGGIYHRFSLDKGKYAKIKRLFAETPAWKAKFRPEGDSDPSRTQYLEKLSLKQATGTIASDKSI